MQMPMDPKPCCGSRAPRHRKECPTLAADYAPPATAAETAPVALNEASAAAQPVETTALLDRIVELERRDEENQKKLQMLYSVADKGRVFNYESTQKEKKPLRVKLSVYNDRVIVGWRTVKDELINDPRTGRVIGEAQQYEVLLLDAAGITTKETFNSYLSFSNARYDQRVECEVIGRREDSEGRFTFDVQLPDGRTVSLDSRFIN